MAQAHAFVVGSGTIMLLTDPSGVILEKAGDPALRDAAEKIPVIDGAAQRLIFEHSCCGST